MTDPQCECGKMRKLLVTGVWVCTKCDWPQVPGAEPPTWIEKLGIDPADEWLGDTDDERK